jgi:predicted transcriptional regulator
MNVDVMMASRYLEMLCTKGIVGKKEFKGKLIYYPRGLRSDDIEKAFSQLKHDIRRDIFLFVLDNPNCIQRSVINHFHGTHVRQVCRLIGALVDSELLVAIRDKNRVRYNLGRVGKKIILGSFETIDPLVNIIREKTGQDVSVTLNDNVVSIEMLDGESVTFQLGKWKMMQLDDDTVYRNKYLLLGDGGEQVLIAIYSGCDDEDSIHCLTTLPPVVIRAKLETLRRMGLVADFGMTRKDLQVTGSGKNVVEKILMIKKENGN